MVTKNHLKAILACSILFMLPFFAGEFFHLAYEQDFKPLFLFWGGMYYKHYLTKLGF